MDRHEGQDPDTRTERPSERRNDRARLSRLSREELYRRQRGLGDKIDAVGVFFIALGVPALLWSDASHVRLVAWGSAIAVVTVITANTTPSKRAGGSAAVIRFLWNWASTLLWGVLPWLCLSAMETDRVAWIMVFVVLYGVATDVVFVPQTLGNLLVDLIAAYSSSYVIALVVVGQWGASFAVLGAVLALMIGGEAWYHVATRLIAERDASDIRALTDELTGLGSREAATTRVAELRRESAPDVLIHCVFADLDDFKQLNDTYGYELGDAALRSVADHLRASLPDDWTIARFGGDEFVAIGLVETDLQCLLDLTISLPADRGGIEVAHRLSIGVTSLPAPEAEAANLFREAAAALRRAKGRGKYRVVAMTDELRREDAARSLLEGRLGTALENREIVPWGQPVVDLRTGVPVGVELLARWPQTDGTMVMPDDFVPLIEEQGRGPQLGMVMVGHGVDLLAEFAARGCDAFVSVNLSARHLFHRRLPHEIRDLLARQAVDPARLVLEITESQHLASSPVWKQTAEQLRSIGVGLAIDDFGTGYSSMEQLLSMPFSHLKVDRVVTQSVDVPGAFDLAAAMAAMAHGSGITPIAEGIETERERDAMLGAGYRHGQGFLFARPQPLAELLETMTDLGAYTTARFDGIDAGAAE